MGDYAYGPPEVVEAQLSTCARKNNALKEQLKYRSHEADSIMKGWDAALRERDAALRERDEALRYIYDGSGASGQPPGSGAAPGPGAAPGAEDKKVSIWARLGMLGSISGLGWSIWLYYMFATADGSDPLAESEKSGTISSIYMSLAIAGMLSVLFAGGMGRTKKFIFAGVFLVAAIALGAVQAFVLPFESKYVFVVKDPANKELLPPMRKYTAKTIMEALGLYAAIGDDIEELIEDNPRFTGEGAPTLYKHIGIVDARDENAKEGVLVWALACLFGGAALTFAVSGLRTPRESGPPAPAGAPPG